MPTRITNKRQVSLPLPDPVHYTLKPYEVRLFPYVEYDKLKNDRRFLELEDLGYILLENPEAEVGIYESEWDRNPKLQLSGYRFWIDGTGNLRMKNGIPLSDVDGVIIGPGGGLTPHGHTHVFTASDPIPNIEVIEAQYSCTVAEQVRDVVFEAAANFVRQANASVAGNMPAVGIVISKPTPTTCILAQSGEIPGYSGLSPGTPYFVSNSVPGAITSVAPSSSGHFVQRVGYAKNGTTFRLEIYPPTKRA
jgi:hypothetical protein